MKKLKNHFQLKNWENSPERTNNERELFGLVVTEFNKETVRILKELRKAINRNADYYKKELETIRKSQEKLKNSCEETRAELKTTKSRINNAEEWISDIDDRIIEITQSREQTETQIKKKYESNISNLWDNIKNANLCLIGISERKEREESIANVFKEIMAGNFWNLKQETDIQI